MIKIDFALKTEDLGPRLQKFWELSDEKISLIEKNYDLAKGSPVFTINGAYSTRGWTEWTQGFQYGSVILQFDFSGDKRLLDMARAKTVGVMAPHISHIGVHDHGFNNVSTYGNLLRLMREEKIAANEWEKNFYELALKISGAVQASRWTPLKNGGYIHSFNGPHSLFVDTMRTCRALVLSHALGHVLQGEGDVRINLLERAVQHMEATARYGVYYGEGRDLYDVWGRTAHESVFNVKDGNYRCPNSQQGYSGFTTWTRGLAWAMCGYAEQLEYMATCPDAELEEAGGKQHTLSFMLKAAKATCDFYIENSPADGIPYWDTGAPQLHRIPDYLAKPADPYNAFEPVDSSAASIAAQGLLRLGKFLEGTDEDNAKRYWQAGLTVLNSLLQEPYLSTDSRHQGLILHSIYHRPNGWDHIPAGSKVPNGESSMWGDYHAREVALYAGRVIRNEKYHTFFNCLP